MHVRRRQAHTPTSAASEKDTITVPLKVDAATLTRELATKLYMSILTVDEVLLLADPASGTELVCRVAEVFLEAKIIPDGMSVIIILIYSPLLCIIPLC